MKTKHRPTAAEIIRLLKLQALPFEGGFFRQTFVSSDRVAKQHLPAAYGEDKPFFTAILYLLTPESFSAFHKLITDELYHYYLGDPAEVYQLHPDGSTSKIILGAELAAGQQVQHLVPRGVWQASRVAPGGAWTLLGTTMAPGYTQSDFELGKVAELTKAYPNQKDLIRQLIRDQS